jgi:riboflavin synthase
MGGVGTGINLERAMKLGDRRWSHHYKDHVDSSYLHYLQRKQMEVGYTFNYDANLNNITIEKGSITVLS